MGPVQQVPFIGKELNDWVFPAFLCMMVLVTLTNAYNRMRRCCCKKGSIYISSTNEDTKDKIMDGKFLIEKYRQQKFMNL